MIFGRDIVVTDPTRLWVSLDASEADLRYLAVGMPLVIMSNQFPDDAFSGTLRQLSDFVDPVARTLERGPAGGAPGQWRPRPRPRR